MKIYPVIDLKSGSCVCTRQGQYIDLEVYSHFPEKVAIHWESLGATYLHVNDLDAAVVGHSVNDEVIKEIIGSVQIPVQVGGGIRTVNDIESKLRLGASRVVIGTQAVKNPAFIREAVTIFGPDKVVVSIDTKNGSVLMDGWENSSVYNPVALVKKIQETGVKSIICADVFRDGMLQGANMEFAKDVIEATNLDVIISGGVSSLKDLELLSELGAVGVILGKAIYEKRIDLKQAIDIFSVR